ncbi:putative ATP-grasp-modified RiPP [Nocardiopsis dassonvillei]|uniref:putative ATP-grasp-modified RiPP n=1 Tax=Nocardiopsis dassonvillei TaxID=2014 RepID=UPI003640EB6B
MHQLPVSPSTTYPWGLSRMAPFPPTEPLPYNRVELNPHTQAAMYFDTAGQPLEAGKHGPSSVMRPTNERTEVDQDGPQGPKEVISDTTTDYVPD